MSERDDQVRRRVGLNASDEVLCMAKGRAAYGCALTGVALYSGLVALSTTYCLWRPGDNDGLQGFPLLVLGLPWSAVIPVLLSGIADRGRGYVALLAICCLLNVLLLITAVRLMTRDERETRRAH